MAQLAKDCDEYESNLSYQEKVFALGPVIYNLKPVLCGDQEIGLIAEEVAEVMPELVILGPERQWV